MPIELASPDRENLADRVISNPRLIELLLERDARIYELEQELSDKKAQLKEIAGFAKTINALGGQ